MSNIVKLPKSVAVISRHSMEMNTNPFPAMDEIHLDLENKEIFLMPEGQQETKTRQETQVYAHEETSPHYNVTALLEEAHQEGFERGYTKAKQEDAQAFAAQLEEYKTYQLEPQIVLMARVLESITNEWKSVQVKIEEAVISLSLTVASKLLKKELNEDSNIVLHQVREGLRHISGVERLKLQLNPLDEAVVRKNKALLVAASDSVKDINIEVNEKITRGGCILESETGNVDATLETQFKKISELLMEDRPLTK